MEFLSDGDQYGGLAPIKWRGMCSACCQLFELCRAEIVERRVSPHRVIETVDISGNGVFGFGAGIEDGSPDKV